MAHWNPPHPNHAEPRKPTVVPHAKPAPAATTSAKPTTKTRLQIAAVETDDSANKSFDPYNSGTFDSRHTWERVNRKK